MNLNLCDFLKLYSKLGSFLSTMANPNMSSLDKRYLDNLEIPVNALNKYEVNKVNKYKIPVRNVFQLGNTLSDNRCVGLRIIVLDTDKHILDYTNKIASKDFATTPGTMTTTAILVGVDVVDLNIKPEQKDDYGVFVMTCIGNLLCLLFNINIDTLWDKDYHLVVFTTIMARIMAMRVLNIEDILNVCTRGSDDSIIVPVMKEMYKFLRVYSFGDMSITNNIHNELAEEFEELFEELDIKRETNKNVSDI